MHSCRVLNISGKFIHGEFSKTEVFWYKQSWVTFSVTSRRGVLTSRRQFSIPLPCRDVNRHVATSKFEASVTSRREISRRDVRFHVATSDEQLSVTSRRQNVTSLSRRDVGFHVATSFGHPLCHVATWFLTSRRHMVMLSATSRRGLSRRDVVKSVLCHVATWPRTSRRETGFKPGIGHFLAFTRANLSPEP